MTPQQQNPNEDRKGGSADLRAVVDDVEKRGGDVIPEQPGCGPNVTDYPGLGAPRGEDAQSSGSDA
jgi:hypothetical protein